MNVSCLSWRSSGIARASSCSWFCVLSDHMSRWFTAFDTKVETRDGKPLLELGLFNTDMSEGSTKPQHKIAVWFSGSKSRMIFSTTTIKNRIYYRFSFSTGSMDVYLHGSRLNLWSVQPGHDICIIETFFRWDYPRRHGQIGVLVKRLK